MAIQIQIQTLRDMLARSQSMVRYYDERIGEKPQQNAALIAAGLKPMHSENTLKWDAEERARLQREIDTIEAMIAHFAPAEAEAA